MASFCAKALACEVVTSRPMVFTTLNNDIGPSEDALIKVPFYNSGDMIHPSPDGDCPEIANIISPVLIYTFRLLVIFSESACCKRRWLTFCCQNWLLNTFNCIYLVKIFINMTDAADEIKTKLPKVAKVSESLLTSSVSDNGLILFIYLPCLFASLCTVRRGTEVMYEVHFSGQ